MKRFLSIFASFLLAACTRVAPVADIQYSNPIIPGFHPDPSICCVGDDFYIVNSSFQYFPGVPVYHSTNLADWELIGNVLDRESQLPLHTAGSWNGIYAPTIRYNDGTFYMVTTNVTTGNNFFVTATDPSGPWSEPIILEQGGIDPSFYFEDGRCYFVSDPGGEITLCEIDPATGRQLSPGKVIWTGMGGRFPEGPHVYKIGKWYYLLISEGGTELAHSLVIARSRKIYGPYKPCPHNPILTHCNHAAQTSQVQGTGHGDLVRAPDGSWWMVFLAYRNYGGSYHHLGRETFLAPVSWEKGWPVVNGGKPVEAGEARRLVVREEFDGAPGPEWLFIQNPDSAHFAVSGGCLTLLGGTPLSWNEHPVFLGRRQEGPAIVAQTKVSLASDGVAGLTVYQISDGHAEVTVQRRGGKAVAVFRYKVKGIDVTGASVPLGSASAVLSVESDGEMYRFFADGREVGAINCSLLSTEVVGGFTGVMLGLFSEEARASFEYFDYREK